MVRKILSSLMVLVSVNISENIKMQGVSIFEELQESNRPCMDKTVYHKQ